MNRFSNYHPGVLFAYFLLILLAAMFSFHPVYLLLSLSGAVFFLIFSEGFRSALKRILLFLPFVLLVTVTNPLFSHNGATPLFFINDSAFTLEALIYGGLLGFMLMAVLLWFRCLNLIFTSEKIIFLFGKISPQLCLVFSMCLHFIPEFKRRFSEVYHVQKLYCNGTAKWRLYLYSFSSVITYSMEKAVITADSMRARGYGLKKRTAFSVFSFQKEDAFFLIVLLFLSSAVFYGMYMPFTNFTVYPETRFANISLEMILAYFFYGILCFLPSIVEIKERLKWKYSMSKI